jgi:hypothetical protein
LILLAKHHVEHNSASHGNRREKQQDDFSFAHAEQPIATIEETTHSEPPDLAMERTRDNVAEVEPHVFMDVFLDPQRFRCVFSELLGGINTPNIRATIPNDNKEINELVAH